MRLTKLELHGFKSFADSTSLLFESGVTAIVGPNGCGKSNVSDAIRWVLGEQRARMMRGAKMDEVIFQGSSARRAVNVAEVSLHFENDDGSLPIAFQEVVITRRLSRSGESEYLLNRAPCRLRDVQDLLRGTGLGSDAGVVIESRMIDALLSDRPDERRDLFEEAAGVGLYRDRRRSTERRLEETTTDLQRLDDLLSEVQTQVRSLSRQRKRAERHEELTARRYSVELTLARREMAAWADELARLETRVAGLRTALPAAEETVREAELARDTAHGARAHAESQRAELARLAGEQRQHVLELRAEMAVAEERQRNALARRQRAEDERREGAAVGERLSADRASAAEERARLDMELQSSSTELASRMQTEEAARARVAAAREGVEHADTGLRELHTEVRRLELDRERAQREMDEVAQRAEQLENELTQLADAAAAARAEMEAAGATLDEARSLAERQAAAAAGAREAARTAREAESAARAELFRADDAHAALQGKVQALEALERERVGLAPAAARLLDARGEFGPETIVGPLSDFISAGAEAALLVERFLGPSLHAVLVRDRAAAEEVRRWHSQARPGPLLLLPLDAAPEAPDGSAAMHESLAAGVDVAPSARAWVAALLGGVQPVDDGSAFVDARGAIWLPGEAVGPGPLRRRAELSRLRQELRGSAEARRTAAEVAEARRAAMEEAERIAAASADRAGEAQRAARLAEEQRSEVARRVERGERELGEARALAERLAARREELAQRLVSVQEEERRAAAALATREGEAAAARQELALAQRAQDEARDARTAQQVEQAQSEARLQVAADRERRLAEQVAAAGTRLESLQLELRDLSDADRTLAEQMESWRLDLHARESALGDAEARLSAAEHAVKETDHALTEAEHRLDVVRREARALADELHQAELRASDLSGRRGAIRERLEAEWRRPLQEMLASLEPLDLHEEALRAEADALRQQVDSLGPVNVLAIEEHDESVRRLEFLTTQRNDLAEAKQSLQQAIREIDMTAKELFLATFTQVRENFRQIFMTLFGGGECDLRLENPEAPLDCDIEIHASPRGKRTQRIHLLSSGERALVALSLLFGIFLTKPSPFCLLDEVDAPLDDANIGRFVRMLRQFKDRTQFIVITHNPRTTTEAADAVYGVTMQEPGVSSLVSVRMDARETEEDGRAERHVEVAAAPV